MTTWFTSDWHLFHANIIKSCRRPFKSDQQMNTRLVDEYLMRVSTDDTVYFLGDLTMRGPKQIEGIRKIVMQLPGHIHLVLGNHDRMKTNSYLRMGFESVHTSLTIRKGMLDYHLVHDPKDALDGTRHLICGHVHDNWKSRNKPCPTVNIGVDVWEFAPVCFSDIVEEMRTLT